MQANAVWKRHAETHEATGLNDLRRQSLLEIGLAMFGMAWIIMTSALGYQGHLQELPIAFLLYGGAAGVIVLRHRNFSLARLVFIGSCMIAIAYQKWLFPDSSAQFYFPVVVVAAALLASTGWSVLGVATLAGLTCIVVARAHGIDWLKHDQISFPIFLIYLTAFAAWIGSRQMHIALGWMQTSYRRADDLLNQLRDERMHLAHTLKMLEEAYYRITKLNYALIEARSAAEAARRLKAEFAANISHELRTPLNLIIGFSETMANAPETYPRVAWSPILRGDIEQIYRSSRHLAGLIDDILDLSALEAEQLGLTVEEMNIQEVLEEAAAIVQDLYRVKRLYLKLDIAHSLPRVRIDAIRIRQVLLNLLTNAIRFTREGGVTISTRLVEHSIEIAVADTGIGIAAQDVSKVFEEFGQVDGATSRSHEGTGLGIPLSKRLIELHGGRLWLESKPQVGTTFFFTLPIIPRGEPSPVNRRTTHDQIALQPQTPAYRKALLAVEPDPLLLRTIRRHMSAYDVLEVDAQADLAAMIDQHQPLALLIDVPGAHDTQDQPACVAYTPSDLPLIKVALPGGLKSAQALGIQNYLIKPVSREQLLDAIADLEQDVRTILIADDDPQLVELLSRMLQSSGKDYHLFKAFRGTEALALLRQQPVDLVLLDMVMPDSGGMDVLRVMKKERALAGIPVIVISAQHPEEIGADTGMFLQVVRAKSTSMTELLTCLKALVGGLPRRDPATPVTSRESPVVPIDRQVS